MQYSASHVYITTTIFKCHYRAAALSQMISRLSSCGSCNSELNFYTNISPALNFYCGEISGSSDCILVNCLKKLLCTHQLISLLHNALAVGTTAYTIQVTDSLFWMLTMMEQRFPSQRRTLPRTPQGEKTCTFSHNCHHCSNQAFRDFGWLSAT